MIKQDIYLRNEYLKLQHLDVLLAIIYLSKRFIDEPTMKFSLALIEDTLCDSFEIDDKRKKALRKAIEYLTDNGAITIVRNTKDHYCLVNNFRVDPKTERFTIIRHSELQQLYKCKTGKSDKIINYFVKLIQTINSTSKVGWTAIETLANTLDVSTKSICQWNTILEQHNLIYIYRYDVCKVVGNHSQNLTNVYGRPCDKALIDAYAQSKLAEIDRVNLSKKLSADARRKISKQYNDYVKGCFKGNVQELIESCNRYNATLKENDPKRKNMSVFDGLVSNDTAVSANDTVHTANDSDSIDTASDTVATADTASATVDIVFKEGVFGVEDVPTVDTASDSANTVDDTTIEDYIFQRQIMEEIFELNAIALRNSSWM